MGNEMGNNNTSAIKEEDNISEAEKKTLVEDASELASGISQDVHADSTVKEENQNISTFMAKNVMENAAKASNDTITKLGKDMRQEDSRADDVKEKTQIISPAESKEVQGKATWFASNNTRSLLSLEGATHASSVSMENQMHPTAEAEDVQEKATVLASDDSTIEHGKVTLQKESHVDDVKEKIHMIPAAEAKDVQEDTTGLISNTASMLEYYSSEGDTHATDVKMENQMHPAAEAEDVQEKATQLASDHTMSLHDKDLLKGDAHADDVNVDNEKHPTAEGKDDQEITSRLGFDDKASEPQHKLKEDKHEANLVIPMANGTNVHGKITILASDDTLNLRNSFGDAVHEITEVRPPGKSPNAGSVEAEGENNGILSRSSLEGTEEYEKQKASCLRKHILTTYNHLNNKLSIKQEDEETMVLTLNAVDMSNNLELQESSSVHSDHDELVKVFSEGSLEGSDSLHKDNSLDTISQFPQIKDGVSEKEMESQENVLCADKSEDRYGNEFGSGLVDTSGITSDSPSIGKNSNGNLLTRYKYITEDSQTSFPESFVVDNPLKSDLEENHNVLKEESKVSRSESTTENSYDHNSDQCMEETLKEFEAGVINPYDMTIGSTGDCNGERHMVLASNVSWIATIDHVEEPKVTVNGLHFDACVNNSNKASESSDETSVVLEQKHSVVPEAEVVFRITGSTVIDCRHEKGEDSMNKLEETNGKPEASSATVKTSEGTEITGQCNSDLESINGKEYFTLQNSSSLLHVYNCQQGNVNQTKSFTATSMPDSDRKQTSDSKYFVTTVGMLDSLNLRVPSLNIDDEAFEKESEYYSHHMEKATSLNGEELTTSAATMSSEPCSNTRESLTRLSTESESDNPNISSQIQKSPSFNLNLQIEARSEESDQTPLFYEVKSSNESQPNQTNLHLINSMPHAEYGQSMPQTEEMPVEEKIVTMERIYSEKSKAPFVGLLKQEEEGHPLVMPQTQHNHAGTKKAVKDVSSTSPKGKENRKSMSAFFSSCMCCATLEN